MKNKVIILIVLLILILITIVSRAQQVTKINKQSSDLETVIKYAFEKGKPSGTFWIGYVIQNSKKDHVSIGSFNYYKEELNITLRDIINNTAVYQKTKTDIRTNRKNSFRIIHGRKHSKILEEELAIIFSYTSNSKDIFDIQETYICGLSDYVELENYPLFWLDKQDTGESLNYLINQFESQNNSESKEDLIAAISVHTNEKKVLPYLIKIFENSDNSDLRDEIPFWIGYQDNKEAFEYLKRVVYESKEEEIIEKAVMGIGQISLDEATDELITIAKKHHYSDVRRDAILWLGQKAVKKAEEALKDFVENDPDIEIKKRAVYALANNSEDHVGYLTELAKSNSSLEIRKCAIYSLSNCESNTAVEALIELLNY